MNEWSSAGDLVAEYQASSSSATLVERNTG